MFGKWNKNLWTTISFDKKAFICFAWFEFNSGWEENYLFISIVFCMLWTWNKKGFSSHLMEFSLFSFSSYFFFLSEIIRWRPNGLIRCPIELGSSMSLYSFFLPKIGNKWTKSTIYLLPLLFFAQKKIGTQINSSHEN